LAVLHARFQQATHTFTDLCFTKCVGKPGARLEKSEETCLGNCVERFLDVSAVLLQRLEENRGR
jgi:import inner membrane translocase subunit TIM8